MTTEKPKYCPNFKALVIKKTNDTDIPFARARCGMWTCEFCAEKNRSIWRARLINHIVHNLETKQWAWFTLTAHSKKRGARLSLKNLRDAWDTLIKRMKRKYNKGEPFDYVRIFEQHKDGSYHLHAIASIHFDDIKYRKERKTGKLTPYSQWLDETADDLKIGYYTHADNFENMMQLIETQSRINSEDTPITQAKKAGLIASYLTKYVTKITPEFKKELGRVRHIQTNQAWSRPEKSTEEKWEMKWGIYYPDVIEAENNGQRYKQADAKVYVTLDDFIDTYIYPKDFADNDKL